jgi:adenosylcobinamide kinase/adenosylcobinamide-phosphate guanylyltransferase
VTGSETGAETAPRLVLVGGGARSGKSRFALERAGQLGSRPLFVATAEPSDDEMRARIARHRQERDLRPGPAFLTVEEPLALPERLEQLEAQRLRGTDPPVDVVVIDCLTLWLSNLLVRGATAAEALAALDSLRRALAACRAHVVLVTNEVGMGLVPETPLGRIFRDVAGIAHQRLASDALARAGGEIQVAVLGVMLRIHPAPIAIVSHPPPSPT